MSDRIWILGPRGAWHETTVEAIDTAREQDRQLVVSCNKLVSVHDEITISAEEPVTGVCGGCFVKGLIKTGEIEPLGDDEHTRNIRHAYDLMARRPLDWHKCLKPVDVNRDEMIVR